MLTICPVPGQFAVNAATFKIFWFRFDIDLFQSLKENITFFFVACSKAILAKEYYANIHKHGESTPFGSGVTSEYKCMGAAAIFSMMNMY